MGALIANYIIPKLLLQHRFNFENCNFELNFKQVNFDSLRHITGISVFPELPRQLRKTQAFLEMPSQLEKFEV